MDLSGGEGCLQNCSCVRESTFLPKRGKQSLSPRDEAELSRVLQCAGEIPPPVHLKRCTPYPKGGSLSSRREEQIVSRSPAAAAAKLLQSYPTLCDPIDGSPLGSPVPGIFQARDWSAVPLSSPNGNFRTSQKLASGL